MPNTFPCNQNPVKFINCCQVMDCIDIDSDDNTVAVVKSECGVDLSISGNNLDNIIKINDGDCVSFIKEFIEGVLHYTPVVDFDCVAAEVCSICPPSPVVFCPTPLTLTVSHT